MRPRAVSTPRSSSLAVLTADLPPAPPAPVPIHILRLGGARDRRMG
jgi:hypothetical protein